MATMLNMKSHGLSKSSTPRRFAYQRITYRNIDKEHSGSIFRSMIPGPGHKPCDQPAATGSTDSRVGTVYIERHRLHNTAGTRVSDPAYYFTVQTK